MPINPPLWKATVSATKEEARNIAAAFELGTAPQAVIVGEEPFEDKAEVTALYPAMPDSDFLSRLAGRAVHVMLLPDVDWIRLSQQGLPPVRAGRFFVYGKHDAGKVPDGVIAMRIEAGMAFGTGHHETTALCLGILSDLAKTRRFRQVLDLGCGTGLLAIGAAKLWKRNAFAVDIDPDAIAVTRENAILNGVGSLVESFVADGPTHPRLREAGRFDLVIANILAGPLTRLSPAISAAVKPGGLLVLSGLLEWQEIAVSGFYRSRGFYPLKIRREHHWSAMILERPRCKR
jgi:ribosomal protein L11 methyltransferase